MKRIRQKLNSVKLRYKLALFYVGFCFLPVMILFLFSFVQMRRIINERETLNLQSYLYQSVATMDGKLEIYDNLSDYIAFDQDLADVFSRTYENAYEQYEQVTEVVDPVLQSLKYFHDKIKTITIYTDNGMVKHDTTVSTVSEVADQEWYQRTKETTRAEWYVEEEERRIFSARCMPTDSGESRGDVLRIEVDYEDLFAPYEQTLTTEYGIFITDGDGNVLYRGDRFSEENNGYRLNYQDFLREQEKGKDSSYLMILETSSAAGWEIWLYQPKGIAGEAMRPVSVMIVLTALLCVVVAVIAYFVTSSLVSGRIEKLTERMREVEQGNLEVTVESEAKDEIGLLYRGFGKMLRRIRTLIDEVYVGKITQKEAEMRALQAQINPHFLYNTLSLINWKAIEAGEDDISRMTLAMSTFYRTALNRGRNTLRVEDELKNTRAYLEIQSMMHDHDFDYEIITEPEILSCESLNLILQPLVENAITHGIEPKTGERGRIVVRGWMEEGCVWFSVEDNGLGMDADTAQKILSMESRGYGVRNVNERIRLCYGEVYGITVESEVGKGTIMRLHFPAR